MSEKEVSLCCDEQRILELAMDMGQILLQSGAEIFRVEDTMRRVCSYFHMDSCNFFVTGNGIMTSTRGTDRPFAKVQYIPMKGARLDRVVTINRLSREIVAGEYESIEEIERRVQEIRDMPVVSNRICYLSSALASASFCILFGGGVMDTLTAFIAGYLLYIFLLRPGKHMSKILSNICGGAIVTILCLLSFRMEVGQNLGHMISGAILPLVPGVAFTNGIRDIGSGDYLSGTVRLLDAFWTILCVAIGVGIVFELYQRFTGGVIL